MNNKSKGFLSDLSRLGKIVLTGPQAAYLTDLLNKGYVTVTDSKVEYYNYRIMRTYALTDKGKAIVSHPSWR